MAIPIAQASPKLLVPRPRLADSRTGGSPGCMMKAPAPDGPGLGMAEPSVKIIVQAEGILQMS